VEILDVANNKYIIGDAGRILPFAKCTTSSQCEVKLRQHAPGDTSNNKLGIKVCECYATSSIQYFDECEGVSTKDDCHLHTCDSKTKCDAYNVHCELYKTENGNDKTVGECKLSNINMDMTSENEDVDVTEVESSENEEKDDVNEVESSEKEDEDVNEVGTTVKDNKIEVKKTENIDKEAELIKEEEDDEQRIIDNDGGLDAEEIESKEPHKDESLVTENRDTHDEVEVKGGKITKKSTPDDTHQGSEHVSEGKVAASPDVPIPPPRRDDIPTPSEIDEAEEEEEEDEDEDENSDVSKEEGESHKKIDDDDNGVLNDDI
jgi:hypothetical protein